MKKIYTFLIAIVIMSSPFLMYGQGETCDKPINVLVGTNTFTGGQDTEQWFSFVASKTGKVVISNCALTSADSYIRVYGGFCSNPLTLIVESDDHCDKQSKVSFIGTAGYDYNIVWLSRDNSDFDWQITEETWQIGEMCDLPMAALEGANNESNHSQATDQWFSYTPTEDGTLTISSCTYAGENTVIGVYKSCTSLMLIGNDDYCGEQSFVEFPCDKDQEYLIQWEKNAISGAYNWSLTFEGTPTNIKKSEAKDLKLEVISGAIKIWGLVDVSLNIELYNISGALVNQENNYKQGQFLDCSSLAHGIYILRAIGDSGIYTKKILIK